MTDFLLSGLNYIDRLRIKSVTVLYLLIYQTLLLQNDFYLMPSYYCFGGGLSNVYNANRT